MHKCVADALMCYAVLSNDAVRWQCISAGYLWVMRQAVHSNKICQGCKLLLLMMTIMMVMVMVQSFSLSHLSHTDGMLNAFKLILGSAFLEVDNHSARI